MLRINLSVNHREIGRIAVYNTKETNPDGQTKYNIYDIREISEGDVITEYPHLGTVWHNRANGAAELTRLAMSKVDENDLD